MEGLNKRCILYRSSSWSMHWQNANLERFCAVLFFFFFLIIPDIELLTKLGKLDFRILQIKGKGKGKYWIFVRYAMFTIAYLGMKIICRLCDFINFPSGDFRGISQALRMWKIYRLWNYLMHFRFLGTHLYVPNYTKVLHFHFNNQFLE